MTTIAVRIKDARKQKGLTQNQVAAALSVSPGAVSHWEQGKTEPSFSNLQKLSTLFDVTFEWLATGRGIAGLQDYLVDLTARYKEDKRLVYLSDDQRAFFDAFGKLPSQWQKHAVELVSALANGLEGDHDTQEK